MSGYSKDYNVEFKTTRCILEYLRDNPGKWVVFDDPMKRMVGWKNLTLDLRVGITLSNVMTSTESAYNAIICTRIARINHAYDLTGKFVVRAPLSTKRIRW